jgi:sulfotransferase family protein
MIIWLASYPRSGNTLLRTLLYQTMGRGTYSDELNEKHVPQPTHLYEHLEIPGGDWQSFYQDATASSDPYLVKTHGLPRDAQPAIYVVRDGRNALTSYAHFHLDMPVGSNLPLLDLILGLDHYGGWSDHYTLWSTRPGPLLLLSYEELVEPSESRLEEIAEFIGHDGPQKSWKNPFENLQRRDPKFYRRGDVIWKGDPEWTPLLDSVFFRLHGRVMAERGYTDSVERDEATQALPPELVQMMETVRRLLDREKSLDEIFEERRQVIDGLVEAGDDRKKEIERLTAICNRHLAGMKDLQTALMREAAETKSLRDTADQRQTVIDELQVACNERGEEIKRLKAICNERESVIERLKIACDERQLACDQRDEAIGRLRAICEERESVIESLKVTCDERQTVIDSLQAALDRQRASAAPRAASENRDVEKETGVEN